MRPGPDPLHGLLHTTSQVRMGLEPQAGPGRAVQGPPDWASGSRR